MKQFFPPPATAWPIMPKMSEMKRSYPAWLLWLARGVTLIYAILIVVFSLMPGEDVPMGNVSDKYRHAAAYGLFALLVSASFLCTRLWRSVATFAFVSLVGLTIEFIQPRFQRSFDLYDALANTIGAALGCGVLVLVQRLTRRPTTQTARP